MGSDDVMVTATTVDGQKVDVVRKNLKRGVHCYAVIFRDERILISPQWRDDGFVFPGGSIELGEDHVAGLVREVKEETGYDIKPRGVIDVFSSMFFNFKTKKAQHSVLIFYSADVIKGRASTDGFDEHEVHYAKKAKWVTLDELKNMKFMCNTQEPIKPIIKYIEARLMAVDYKELTEAKWVFV